MDLADALILLLAAFADLAVLVALRRYRRWQYERPSKRIARSLAFALRSGPCLAAVPRRTPQYISGYASRIS